MVGGGYSDVWGGSNINIMQYKGLELLNGDIYVKSMQVLVMRTYL
jgi:hypothetical protein